MINQRLKDVCERIDKLVPGLEQGDLMEYALDKIADHIEKQNAALEFVRQNLSKMHIDDNIRDRCLAKIKEVLG